MGYTLPQSIAGKLNMQKFRAYVLAQNVLTFKKSWGPDRYTSFDPEIRTYAYLIPLIVNFGINVTF